MAGTCSCMKPIHTNQGLEAERRPPAQQTPTGHGIAIPPTPTPTPTWDGRAGQQTDTRGARSPDRAHSRSPPAASDRATIVEQSLKGQSAIPSLLSPKTGRHVTSLPTPRHLSLSPPKRRSAPLHRWQPPSSVELRLHVSLCRVGLRGDRGCLICPVARRHRVRTALRRSSRVSACTCHIRQL